MFSSEEKKNVIVVKQSLLGLNVRNVNSTAFRNPCSAACRSLSSAVNPHAALFVSCFLPVSHDLSRALFQVRILALHLPRTPTCQWTIGLAVRAGPHRVQVTTGAGSFLWRRLLFTVSVMSGSSPYLQTRPGKDREAPSNAGFV